MTDRYQADGPQVDFEPGSGGQVLANKLGITEIADIEEAELILPEKLYDAVLVEALPERALTVADLRIWHRRWLGNVYSWAGEERSVNLSKGDFHFAIAAQIPRLLSVLERDCLLRFTPCDSLTDEALIEAIAVTHVEFILIHPFREGNGRLSRLLADVMAVQAGRDPLDYSPWDADRQSYFAAIQRGLANDYEPMKQLVATALGV
ncbi:Fic/DOC family protein [Nevskia ramosa]|uniref:Fic/DOC family protein n=1 Tax=Nevskia ramosa TaxID=64002 RepID=UPI002356B1D4|nr:Fic family protein [Nevskia ramosa]